MNEPSGVPGWVLVTVMVAGVVVGLAALTGADLSAMWTAITEP